jgi:hypothetical protein
LAWQERRQKTEQQTEKQATAKSRESSQHDHSFQEKPDQPVPAPSIVSGMAAAKSKYRADFVPIFSAGHQRRILPVQPYRNLKNRMIPDKSRQRLFEAMIAPSSSAIPYISHNAVASTITENIPREMSWVDRVRQVRITCGKYAAVEHVAAADPISVTNDIVRHPYRPGGPTSGSV